jgi:hypothetical protein
VKTKTTDTHEAIASMLTENTGSSILDSGGAYGRHWQRNTGMTVDLWEQTQPISCDPKWGDILLSTYHYLADRVELDQTLDEQFRMFSAASDEHYYTDMHDWVAAITGTEYPDSFNTYNWENNLTQDLQGITFGFCGDRYAIIQTHNGCDIRGGYSTPRVFRVTADYFPYDVDDYMLCCSNNYEHSLSRSGEWIAYEGCPTDAPIFNEDRGAYLCPQCDGTLHPEVVGPY